jgi:predicted ATPase
MASIGEFTIIETIASTHHSTIYRAQKAGESHTVIIKAMSINDSSDIKTLKHEYYVLKNINLPGVIKYTDLLISENGFAIVMEDFYGRSIRDFIGDKGIPLSDFLKIARETASIIGQLHLNNIIHKDIKPHNILADTTLSTIKITDFGISTSVKDIEHTDLVYSESLNGTFAYISPEQTTLLKKSIDYRTDLYSLGITFYELITGELPFKESDPNKLLNAHITKIPLSPQKINPHIPQVISEIIMKLLAKNPDDRYQSGFGLVADFDICINDLQSKGSISKFTPGKHDFSMKLSNPQRIYGRDKEISLLMDCFSSIKRKPCSFMFIKGSPGIGKSKLVNHFSKILADQNLKFIMCKFEQFKYTNMFSAVAVSINEYCQRVIGDGNAAITEWKTRILSKMGTDCKYLISFIPLLEYITDQKAEHLKYEIIDLQDRLIDLFIQLLSTLATHNVPLALFYDDIHWADSASLRLFESIAKSDECTNMFILFSIRKSEIDGNIRFYDFLDKISKSHQFHEMELEALSETGTSEIIAEVLKLPQNSIEDLASMIHQKTGGNPFFIIQLLKVLYQEKLLYIDSISGWKWDIPNIARMQVSENVLEIILKRVNQLDPDIKNILQYCAVIGRSFTLTILSKITNTTEDQLSRKLSYIVNQELLNLQKDTYTFPHDKIQEVIFHSMSKDISLHINYQIGTSLLPSVKHEVIDETFFMVVDNLNKAIPLLTNQNDIINLSALNLSASRKVKLSTDFDSALQYIEYGLSVLNESHWAKHYSLMLDLHTEATELSYLTNRQSKLAQFSSDAIKSCKNAADMAQIYLILIKNAQSAGSLQEVILYAFDILEKLDVAIPVKVPKYIVLFNLIKAKLLLAGKNESFFINQRRMSDPTRIAAVAILNTISPTTFFMSQQIYAMTIFKRLELFIHYGIRSEALISLMSYGILHCGVLQDYATGYKYGKLAIDLKKHIDPGRFNGQLLFRFYGFINLWKNDLRETYIGLLESFDSCVDCGDYDIASMAAFMLSCYMLICGNNISEKNPVRDKLYSFLEKNNQTLGLMNFNIFCQSIENLTSEEITAPHILSGSYSNEDHLLERLRDTENKSGLAMYYACKLMVSYMFEKSESSVILIQHYTQFKGSVKSTYLLPLIIFYETLTVLSIKSKHKLKEYNVSDTLIKSNLKILMKMAKHAPVNYQNKVILIQAEIARCNKKHERALKLYREAFKLAIQFKFPNEAALACEIATNFCISINKKDEAKQFAQNAIKFYAIWGANAMVIILKNKYSHLFTFQDK